MPPHFQSHAIRRSQFLDDMFQQRLARWNREAILPLVEEDPRRATAVAEGALLRLRCGLRCFERYRAELW